MTGPLLGTGGPSAFGQMIPGAYGQLGTYPGWQQGLQQPFGQHPLQQMVNVVPQQLQQILQAVPQQIQQLHNLQQQIFQLQQWVQAVPLQLAQIQQLIHNLPQQVVQSSLSQLPAHTHQLYSPHGAGLSGFGSGQPNTGPYGWQSAVPGGLPSMGIASQGQGYGGQTAVM